MGLLDYFFGVKVKWDPYLQVISAVEEAQIKLDLINKARSEEVTRLGRIETGTKKSIDAYENKIISEVTEPLIQKLKKQIKFFEENPIPPAFK